MCKALWSFHLATNLLYGFSVMVKIFYTFALLVFVMAISFAFALQDATNDDATSIIKASSFSSVLEEVRSVEEVNAINSGQGVYEVEAGVVGR